MGNTEKTEQFESVRFRSVLPFFIANGLIYTLTTIYYSFIPKYLKDIAEKSDSEIGILLSVGPLVGIISLLFFGVASDKAKYKNNVLMFIIISAAIIFCMVRLNNSLIYLMIIFAAFMFFLSPFSGLLDAISLEYTTAAGIKYGPIRAVGSLFFGIVSMILTLVLSFFGNILDIKIIFPVFVVTAVFCVIAVKRIPPVKGHARGKKNIAYKNFFKDKMIITLFIIVFISQFSFGCFFNFAQNFIDKDLSQPPWIWGLVVVFTVVGEIAFFLMFDYIFKKFSIKSIIILGIFVQLIRYLSFAFMPTGIAILITSFFTGSFTTVIHYSGSYYINITSPKEMRAFGQTLLFSISFCVARFLSGIVGGFTVENFGFTNLMMICAGINLVLLVSSKLMPFKEATLNK